MPVCPQCLNKLVKRSSPEKHYACKQHGFARKVHSPHNTASQINQTPAIVTTPSAPRVKKPVAFPRGEKN